MLVQVYHDPFHQLYSIIILIYQYPNALSIIELELQDHDHIEVLRVVLCQVSIVETKVDNFLFLLVVSAFSVG